MNRILKITLLVFCCLAMIAVGRWRYQTAEKAKSAHFGIAFDRSESTRSGCDCIARLARRVMSSPGITPQSTLTVLAIGNQATANEPVAVAQYQLPVLRKVIDGRESVNSRQAEILNDLTARCEKVATSDRSPILFTVMRGLEGLHNQGCGSGSACTLFVVSDGEELVDQSLKQAINGQKQQGKDAPPLDNADIRIIFVGVAETNGLMKSADHGARQFTRPRDLERARRLQEAWRARFTQPDLVRFEPYCTSVEELSK